MIRLIIADDDGAVRARLRGLLEGELGIEIVAADGDTALVRTRALAPGVLVLDEQMPGAWGSEVAQTLARDGSATRTIIYSAEDTVHGWAAASARCGSSQRTSHSRYCWTRSGADDGPVICAAAHTCMNNRR